ncbi:hypothetical protein PAXRUDRAFT_131945 [Paxillus rubicundulus Ve08.2h10]|uniref:Copper transporter n=1 Tax=Paxillus rubicundulus Ve08.2h10 TaxID=930991 RepID=A0A0D0E4W3_9AGAM|nr:hypothetical protein PAXRUDRAFT_131945 [Paxillus rubicundulus Ve08.2h10]
MDGWVDYLHLGFLGEHILFSSLRLHSFWAFLLSSVVITVVCLSERFLTVVLNKHVQPRWARSRLANAVWRSSVYGLVTLLRLLYMLVAMSYQLGLKFTLQSHRCCRKEACSQACASLRPRLLTSCTQVVTLVEEPLLSTSVGRRLRPHARSKPTAILIHPNESNLARADAAALELGIAGDTELVKGNRAPDGQESWQQGKGRDVAREMFGDTHYRQHPDASNVFDIGDDEEHMIS